MTLHGVGPHLVAGHLPSSDFLPRAFRHEGPIKRRRQLLGAAPPHMAPLIALTEALRRQRPDWQVPDFDPASGGVEARALFLFEKPGPKTAADTGSGFISVNNNDSTAAATYHFALETNGLPLGWCLFANVIPWWDGHIRISAEQRKLSSEAIKQLLALLPALRVIVLVGRIADRAWAKAGASVSTEVTPKCSDHPSPLVRARWPERWNAIPASWPTRADLT